MEHAEKDLKYKNQITRQDECNFGDRQAFSLRVIFHSNKSEDMLFLFASSVYRHDPCW